MNTSISSKINASLEAHWESDGESPAWIEVNPKDLADLARSMFEGTDVSVDWMDKVGVRITHWANPAADVAMVPIQPNPGIAPGSVELVVRAK